jgi:16S rRNA (cytosine967-C5)-methyltransferase
MDARIATIRIITGILQGSGSLSKLVPKYITKVIEADRALVQELSYGTLRYYPKLQLCLDFLLKKPFKQKDKDIEAAIACAIYQITETRVPSHAAVNESVKACRVLNKPWATNLVNAVLRRFVREKIELEKKLVKNVGYTTSHPKWLIELLEDAWPEQLVSLIESNNTKPPMTLRVNINHNNQSEYLSLLRSNGVDASATITSPDGITLKKPLDVFNLPNFSIGAVSVQDEAAQFSAHLLELMPKQRILDACCAPGGKTCHILEHIKRNCFDNSSVTSIDISKERLDRVQENLDRLQLHTKLVACDIFETNVWWDKVLFDRILLDAPCSATGVIRRNPDIKILRKSKDIQKLAILQLELLNTVWPTLRKNGLLLYATCSILPQENDMVISRFLDSVSDAAVEKTGLRTGIETSHGRQLLPSVNGYDGFYYARLRKL